MSSNLNKELIFKTFVATSIICAQFSTREQYLQDANKLCQALSLQMGESIDLHTLAIFKALLPEEIDFLYHELPLDDDYGQAPEFMIIFEFREKAKKRKRKAMVLMTQVKDRITRFNEALSFYLETHTVLDLLKYSAEFVPKPISFEDEAIPITSTPKLKVEPPLTFEETLCNLDKMASASRIQLQKDAKFGTVPKWPSSMLSRFKINQLYSHQAEGINAIEAGKNVVISTATASGKSLIFQIPILEDLEMSPTSCFMFIYPTKALAQDQSRSLRGLLGSDVIAGTFDGDTPFEQREYLRDHARVLFCNPDILHTTLLPKWSDWQRYLSHLKIVVVDELHCYSGVFGAHVGMVFRRLRRLCHVLGNDFTQWVACSATVRNPVRFFSQLTGLPQDNTVLVDNDGSPHGVRHYFFLESPLFVANDPSSGRISPIHIAAPLFISLIRTGLRVIAFCPYRKSCELMMRAVRENATKLNLDVLDQIMSYRGGYNPDDRRLIEQKMFSGALKGIVSTSALELGIDIGNLDVVICVGFPFSLASFRQQVGRAGRRQKCSLAILVANGSVMDMSYIHNPDKVFTDPVPAIPLSLDFNLVLDHAICASAELSLSDEDAKFFPSSWSKITDRLELQAGEYHCPKSHLPDPSKLFSLRAIEEEQTLIVDVTGKRHAVIETIERERVPFTCYPGAIYNNQGIAYIVINLEKDQKFAEVTRTSVRWTTRQRDFTDLDPFEKLESGRLGPIIWSTGRVLRHTLVFGYFKFNEKQKIFDTVDVDLPPIEKLFNGLWVDLESSCLESLKSKKLNAAAAIHAAQHIILSLAPKYVSCCPSDLGTECKSPEKELMKGASTRIRPARLIFYEKRGCTNGSGLFNLLVKSLEPLMVLAIEVLRSCPCASGCDCCIALPDCKEKNIVLSKLGARVVLQTIMGQTLDDIPDGPEPEFARATAETVVAVIKAPVGPEIKSIV